MKILARPWYALVGFAMLAAIGGTWVLGGSGSEPQRATADEQREADPLADGEVTINELEAAIVDTTACLEREGLNVETIPRDRLRPTKFRISAPDDDGVPDRESVNDAQARTSTCLAGLDPVSYAWREQLEPSPEEVEEFYSGLEECVADGGVPSAEPELANVFVGYPQEPRSIDIPDGNDREFLECAREFEARTGLLPPAPWENSPAGSR